MKKSYFSKGLYLEGVRRLRIFGLLTLALFTLAQISPAIVHFFESTVTYKGVNDTYTPTTINFSYVLVAVPFMTIFGTIAMVHMLFSVFNKRASSDFYHALPYTRPCIFISFMAAVYTWVIGICTVCTLIGIITYAAMPDAYTLVFTGALDTLASHFAVLLITSGATALAMALTGNTFSNGCVTLLILFLPRFIITMITSWITDTAEFLVFSDESFSLLSPSINVFFASFSGVDTFENNIFADIYSVLLGAAYLALALFVFTKRKSETATQSAPDRITQAAIRILITMVTALFAVMLFLEGEYSGFVIISIITVIVYFAYELFTTKKWKNCLRALPGLGILAGLCIICGIIMVVVPMISSGFTPKASEIDHVRFVNADRYDDNWFDEKAEKLKLKDQRIFEIVSTALSDNMEEYKKNQSIIPSHYLGSSLYDYALVTKTVAINCGGITHYRNICFSGDQYDELLTALSENKEYASACMTLPDPARGSLDFGVTLYDASEKEKKEIFDTLKAEILEKSFEEWHMIASQLDYSWSDATLYYQTDDYYSQDVYVPISSEKFPKTFASIMELENKNANENLKTIKSDLNDKKLLEKEDLWYVFAEVIVRKTENGESNVYNICADYDNYMYDSNTKGWDSVMDTGIFDYLIEYGESTSAKPTAENYAKIMLQYEFEEKPGVIVVVYVPLPEDFSPEAFALEKLN